MGLLVHIGADSSTQGSCRRIVRRILPTFLSSFSRFQTLFIRLVVRPSRKEMKMAFERILVVKLDELGDSVLAWPMLSNLRRDLPNAEITIVLNKPVAGLWESLPGFRVIGLDLKCRKFLRPFLLPIRHYLFVRKHFRNEEFDLCIIPRRDSDSVYATFLGYFSKARRRISFSEVSTPRKAIINRGFDSLLTDVMAKPPLQHETLSNQSMLPMIGLAELKQAEPFPVPNADLRYSRAALPQTRMCYVALCPTSGHSVLKQWGVERFAELSFRLISMGITVVLIGSGVDIHLGDIIQEVCGGKCSNFIGKTTPTQMAALLGRCSVFVGNDAGPMHVASVLGVPTVGIFGSTCPHQFGPWAPHRAVIKHEMNCSPCQFHDRDRCDTCIHGHPICLEQVTVEEVLAAVINFIGQSGSSAPK